MVQKSLNTKEKRNINLNTDWIKFQPKRGEIYYADLRNTIGSEQGGLRPVFIVQNDIGNRYSPTVQVAAITSSITKAKLPTHVEIGIEDGMDKPSIILLEQQRTIDKSCFDMRKVTTLTKDKILQINDAIMIQTGLVDVTFNQTKAFTLINQIDLLVKNINIKQSKDLTGILNEKVNELKSYCGLHRKDSNNVILDYNSNKRKCYVM